MPEIYSKCFYCRSAAGWTLAGLKFALDTDRLCDLHKAIAEEKIKSAPLEKEEMKIPGSFLQQKKIKNPRNWQDREYNKGELIE